jgi:UDP-3-O-[3-hydroxymyristoyl] N-acetylglucosamine deacetylase
MIWGEYLDGAARSKKIDSGGARMVALGPLEEPDGVCSTTLSVALAKRLGFRRDVLACEAACCADGQGSKLELLGMNKPSGWCANEGTLARALMITGHGLHTGRNVQVRVLPREAGAGQGGILFKRMRDGQMLAELAVSPQVRHAQPLCTALKNAEGTTVRTVEHLLAALLACEIDHAVVELDAEEVPILDGSAAPWISAIRACGRTSLAARKRFIRVLKSVEVSDGTGNARRELRLDPSSGYGFRVRDEMKGFDEFEWRGELTPAVFASEIAASRSYGRIKWAVPAIAAGYLSGQPILRGARISCTAAIVGKRVLGGCAWRMSSCGTGCLIWWVILRCWARRCLRKYRRSGLVTR